MALEQTVGYIHPFGFSTDGFFNQRNGWEKFGPDFSQGEVLTSLLVRIRFWTDMVPCQTFH